MKKDSFCSFCGNAFAVGMAYPKRCTCGNTTYINPAPVAVALVPVNDGLLAVRRNIEPKKGMLALPGGFIDVGETWQQAVVRELREETNITLDIATVSHFATLSAPDGTLLVFGLFSLQKPVELSVFQANSETQEICVIDKHTPSLAFPLHTEVMKKYFLQK
jgi:ADP-ribose pyrophosphatase YjhB (NUDIX family)